MASPKDSNNKTSKPKKKSSPIAQQRRHLDQRLQYLNRRVILLEQQLKQLEDPRFYRTCIFGSARIKAATPVYDDVVVLARLLAEEGIDILTGGGPGLMEAANKGAQIGKESKQSKTRSYGMTIELDFEPLPNNHLDIKRHHLRFSTRLDDFMRLSHSIVVTPGGIGTLLELFFSWQLIQVRHISARPIVLLDKAFWAGLIEWIRNEVLGRSLIAPQDMDTISIVDKPEEAFEIIRKHRQTLSAPSNLDVK